MQTSVKTLSDTKVKLTVKLDAVELADAESVALVKLARDLKVDGFRKGKVPLAVANKNVDQNTLANETLDTAISKAIAEAFTTEKLRVIAPPQVEITKFVPKETVEFTAEADIVPAIKLGDYKHLKAKPEKVTITEKEIDDLVERLRSGLAKREEVKREAKMGDEVIIDFVGKKDGEAFDGGTSKDFRLSLGSGQFIPGFEEGIVGHKPGDKFDLELAFPQDYHAKNLAGAKVVFETTLHKIEALELPKVDDEFAAKVGPFKTVAEMRQGIKADINEQKTREAGEKLKDALADELAEISNVPVPEVLVEDQIRSVEQDFQQNLMYQGLTLESYISTQKFKDEDDWRAKEVRPTAVKRVKIGLVLSELASELKISATEDEIEAHVDLYRRQYGNNPSMAEQFARPEVRNDIANRLLTEKTINKLVELNA